MAYALAVVLVLVLVLVGALLLARRKHQRERWYLHRRLSDFFGTNCSTLPILSRPFNPVDLPNLQRAIEAFAGGAGATRQELGYTAHEYKNTLRLMVGSGVTIGPVQYQTMDTGPSERISCVLNGLHLLDGSAGRFAIHVNFDRMSQALLLEVMATDSAAGARVIEEIRAYLRTASVYRGKVISLGCDDRWGRSGFSGLTFHRLAPVAREGIILPTDVLALIERNTLGFLAQADALRRASRSLRRGILLHGRPGTGKTYTSHWLAQAVPGLTVILASGDQLAMIKECCAMARMLAPALVILEDVDLIAAERDATHHPFLQVTLHQLLNEMDGIGTEAEVLFILTTNRPEVLEPALAGRPGRIDQAIELPLPDADCRRRLFELYGQGLTLNVPDWAPMVARTDGASPAFIRELLRKAALLAALDGAQGETLRVTETHLESALRELVFAGGELTRALLGFTEERAPADRTGP